MRRSGASMQVAGAAVVALLLACLGLARPAAAQTPADLLKQARDAFEYGDYARVVTLAKDLPETGALTTEADRIEAYRLLGLSHFYLRSTDAAEKAFLGLLRQNPDFQLDPFYVPPVAVAFFDEIRRREEKYLAPIRERRNRRQSEEAAAARARAEEEARRREAESRPFVVERPVPVYVERPIVQNSPYVLWLPFGAGQFQNGDLGTGVALAAGEALAAAASIASYLLIESLRNPATGRFDERSLQTARTFDTVKWVSAGLFYALWAGGIVDAHLRFVPTRAVDAPPSAAPAGPLTPPRTGPSAARTPSEPPPRGEPNPAMPAREAPSLVPAPTNAPASVPAPAAPVVPPPVEPRQAGDGR